jgi:hypothetical protein
VVLKRNPPRQRSPTTREPANGGLALVKKMGCALAAFSPFHGVPQWTAKGIDEASTQKKRDGACSLLPTVHVSPAMSSLGTTLRLLPKRWTALYVEMKELDKHARLATQAAPKHLARFEVCPQTATVL